jgi:hypothetical protein
VLFVICFSIVRSFIVFLHIQSKRRKKNEFKRFESRRAHKKSEDTPQNEFNVSSFEFPKIFSFLAIPEGGKGFYFHLQKRNVSESVCLFLRRESEMRRMG